MSTMLTEVDSPLTDRLIGSPVPASTTWKATSVTGSAMPSDMAVHWKTALVVVSSRALGLSMPSGAVSRKADPIMGLPLISVT